MPYPGLDLTGRKALVTGAARGIGAALAVGLAQAGADVAVSDLPTDAARAGLDDTARRIRNEGRSSYQYDMDVQSVPAINATIQRAAADLGGLDILVNNAGIRRRAPALEVTEEDWDAVLDTNLKGVFFCAQAAAQTNDPQPLWQNHQHIFPAGAGGRATPRGILLQQGRRRQPDPRPRAGMGRARHHRKRHRSRPHHNARPARS